MKAIRERESIVAIALVASVGACACILTPWADAISSSARDTYAASTADPSTLSVAQAAARRAALHMLLDEAKDGHVHDVCLQLRDVGDASSVPHLIRVLQFFGDAELPLPPGVGIVCTQQHCADTLEQLAGVKVGISYSSWKRWWEATHPGQPLPAPPNKRVNPPAGAGPPR